MIKKQINYKMLIKYIVKKEKKFCGIWYKCIRECVCVCVCVSSKGKNYTNYKNDIKIILKFEKF